MFVAAESAALSPALVLMWGLAAPKLSDPDQTFAAGTGFLLDKDHLVTAAHIGHDIDKDCNNISIRSEGSSNRRYRMHALDPRTGMLWRLTRSALETSDFRVYQVVPEEKITLLQWRAWDTLFSLTYPQIRMSPLVEGEALQIRAFQT